MFTENPNIETIYDGIYVYRNFLEKEYVDKISAIAFDQARKNEELNHSNNWYNDKVFYAEELVYSYKKLSELLMPDFYIVPDSSMIITKTGDEMFVHTDSPEHDNPIDSPDPFHTCHIVDYGTLMYFGEWTGGDLFYPELDITISPRPGDLVIHKSRHPYEHGVRKIESGIRAAQSLFAVSDKNHPGTFVKYGSDEFKQIENSENPLQWLKANKKD